METMNRNLNLEEKLIKGIEEDGLYERIEQNLENGDHEPKYGLIPERRNVDENEERRYTEKEVREKTVSIECQNQTIRNSKKGKRILIPWTEEQKKIIMSYFKNHVRSKKLLKEEKVRH
ncbi:hypothetical protein QE152_g24974 [Popillia japonica]|uniref:Uncharacterized protein n=1 Tax=Popillia japonica TaxID=7064 RepID=A0AAW1K270_POPJA